MSVGLLIGPLVGLFVSLSHNIRKGWELTLPKNWTSEQEFKTLARCFFFPTHADFVFSVIVIVIEYFSIIIPTSLSDFNRCENILFHWEYRRERWRGEEAIDEMEVKI